MVKWQWIINEAIYMSAIKTFNVEAGRPTLDDARRLVIDEIKRAKREGVTGIHGGTPLAH